MKIIFLRLIKFISPVLFFSAIFCQNSAAQIDENQIIIDPYQTQVFIPGQSPGSAGISFSDSMPHFYANPASLSSVHRYSLFLSSSVSQGQIKIINREESFIKSENHSARPAPGLFAFALPVRLFHHSVTVAASFNPEIPYDYQLHKDSFNRTIDHSGHLRTMKLGVGINLSPAVSIGVGWTRWFGERKVNLSDPLRENRTSQKSIRYNGESFYIGAQNKINGDISLDAELYFPFQLKIDDHETERGRNFLNSALNHKFAGGLRIGLGYKINPSSNIGIDYFYQKRFETKSSTDSSDPGTEYSAMHSFSMGIGHRFTFLGRSVPIHLTYRFTQPPINKTYDRLFYPQGIPESKSDDKFISHILELGGNTTFRYVTVFLNVRWQLTGRYVKYPSALT